MASIGFDKSTGWWSCRYYAGPGRGRIKQNLCKHPPPWSPSKPPRKPPAEVRRLAEKFEGIERLARLGQATPDVDRPLAPHVREYIDAYDRTHRANSTQCLRGAAGHFLEFCAGQKVTTLQGVTPNLCAAWLDSRLAGGIKPSSVRTERAYLAAIWATARRRRVVAENPWEFARVEGPREEAAPKFWAPDELVALIGAMDGWLRDWVVLDLNTGLRVSALLGLRWRDVDFANNRIVVPAALQKSGRSLTLPMTPDANAVLARRSINSEGPSDFLFANPGRPGRPHYHRRTVQDRIKHAIGKAGLRDFGSYCHALRHSFAVALVNADVSIRVIQALLGHATIRTTEVYAKLAPGKAEAIMNGFTIGPTSASEKPSTPATDRPE